MCEYLPVRIVAWQGPQMEFVTRQRHELHAFAGDAINIRRFQQMTIVAVATVRLRSQIVAENEQDVRSSRILSDPWGGGNSPARSTTAGTRTCSLKAGIPFRKSPHTLASFGGIRR